MTSSFYRNNAAVLICYDCSNSKSFDDVRGFLEECNRFNPSSIKLLIACKSDLEDERVVDPAIAREFNENQSLVQICLFVCL
jgi:GTPase SAR1 family protein